jgi:predicted TIM-barrel fold metal-dependent hydrolase
MAGQTEPVLGRMAWHVGDDLTALALKIDRAARAGRFGQVLIHPPSAGLHPALFRVIQERLAPLVFNPKTG